MLTSIVPVALSAAVAFLARPGDERPAAPLFVDVTDRALPGVTTTSGRGGVKDWIVEVNGGGLALGDFDGDGAVDLVVVDGSTIERVGKGEPGFPPRLFLGDGKGAFAPALGARSAADARDGAPATHWEMSGGRWGMGCAAGDANGDGYLDLVVTQWGPDRVFANDAGRGFDEVEESGLARDDAWSTSAAFLDCDADGALDLAVVTYLAFDPGAIPSRESGACTWKGHPVMCGPEGLEPTHDRLYRGKGDATFEDATERAGFRPERAAFGLGVTTLDVDLDGDTDLYVTNDSTPNHLWVNRGDGTFEEKGLRLGVSHDDNGKEQAGMGIAVGDASGDGKPDIFVTNFSGESNAFYRSGARSYRERSDASGFGGPSRRFLGWGTGMYDLDLDGDQDLFVLNGHVYPEADSPGSDTSYRQASQLYRNGGARFTVEELTSGPDRVWRAGAGADLDGDGDVDVVGIELDGAVRVLENRTSGRHWLRVRLAARGGNKDALGARVTAYWDGGQLTSEVRTAGGFQAAQPPEVHFGLGGTSRVARLVVHWPSGREQELADVAADRVLRIEEDGE